MISPSEDWEASYWKYSWEIWVFEFQRKSIKHSWGLRRSKEQTIIHRILSPFFPAKGYRKSKAPFLSSKPRNHITPTGWYKILKQHFNLNLAIHERINQHWCAPLKLGTWVLVPSRAWCLVVKKFGVWEYCDIEVGIITYIWSSHMWSSYMWSSHMWSSNYENFFFNMNK